MLLIRQALGPRDAKSVAYREEKERTAESGRLCQRLKKKEFLLSE